MLEIFVMLFRQYCSVFLCYLFHNLLFRRTDFHSWRCHLRATYHLFLLQLPALLAYTTLKFYRCGFILVKRDLSYSVHEVALSAVLACVDLTWDENVYEVWIELWKTNLSHLLSCGVKITPLIKLEQVWLERKPLTSDVVCTIMQSVTES